ncbi:MAG: exodeoxyribonuclease VII large subunit [Oligosphaeraceae bacterium]
MEIFPPPATPSLAHRLFARHDPKTVWTVSEISRLVKCVVQEELDFTFWICGELAFTSHASSTPHLYADLRDEQRNSFPLVCFHGQNILRQQNIQNGDRVFAFGRLGFYEPAGRLQFIAQDLRKVDSDNTLVEIMRKTLARLAEEGLTDKSRFKPIPPFPRRVGVVSSLDAAGCRDFLTTCLAYTSCISFLLAPTRVQGEGAAADILAAIRLLEESGECDLIVVTRGGGSIQDLWCFNDESLARGIAAARTPILTAIGHERDDTLADHVADASAITPTKAAETITRNYVNLQNTLRDLREKAESLYQHRLDLVRTRWEHCRNSLVRRDPRRELEERKARLVTDTERLYRLLADLPQRQRQLLGALRDRLLHHQELLLRKKRETLALLDTRLRTTSPLRQKRETLAGLQTALRTLDPTSVLKRGYSILLDDRHNAIRQAEEAPPGTRLTALLGKGQLTLAVENSTPNLPR